MNWKELKRKAANAWETWSPVASSFGNGLYDGTKFAARNITNAAHGVNTLAQGIANGARNTVNYPFYLGSKALGWKAGQRMWKPRYSTWWSDNTTKRVADFYRQNLPYSDQNRQYIQTDPWMRGIQLAQQQSLEDAATLGVAGMLGKGVNTVSKGLPKAQAKPAAKVISQTGKQGGKISRAWNTVKHGADVAGQKAKDFIGHDNLRGIQAVLDPIPYKAKIPLAAKLIGRPAALGQAFTSFTGAPIPFIPNKYQPVAKQALDWLGWLDPVNKLNFGVWQHTPFGAGILTGTGRKFISTPQKARNLAYFADKMFPSYFAQFKSPQGIYNYMKDLGADDKGLNDLARDLGRAGTDWGKIKDTVADYTKNLNWSLPFTLSGLQKSYLPLRKQLFGYPHTGKEQEALIPDVKRDVGNALVQQPL